MKLSGSNKTAIAVAGIFSVTLLEALALLQGVNGVLLAGVVGAVTSVVGWALGARLAAPRALPLRSVDLPDPPGGRGDS